MSEEISDPLASFYQEEQTREAGVRDPITGIREPFDKVEREKKRYEEMERKKAVTKRVIMMLMNDQLGREWLFDLLTMCNVFGTPYVAQLPDITAYNSGALFVGRSIEGDIKKHSLQEYILMLQEGEENKVLWNDSVADK